MGLGGLGHKAATMEVDQETGRGGETLGLQPQRQRDGTSLSARERQQSFTVLERIRQKGIILETELKEKQIRSIVYA